MENGDKARRQHTSSNIALLASILGDSFTTSQRSSFQTAGLHLGSAMAKVLLAVLHESSSFGHFSTHLDRRLSRVSSDIAEQGARSEDGDKKHVGRLDVVERSDTVY